MNKGKCLLIGTPDELREITSTKQVVEIALAEITPKIVAAVKDSSNTKEVEIKQEETTLLVSVTDARLATPEVVRSVVEADGRILAVNIQRPSLEEAYLKLIKGGEKQ